MTEELYEIMLIIEGAVQGVNFRSFVVRRARELGLVGWVKNLAGNGVEVLAEGYRPKLELLLEACKIGPAYAEVKKISVEFKPIEKLMYQEFLIVH